MKAHQADNATHDSLRIRALHLFVITAMALSQPLFQTLSVQAEFIAAHRLDRYDLWLLITVLAVILPLMPALLYRLLVRLWPVIGHGFYLLWLLLGLTAVLTLALYSVLDASITTVLLALAASLLLCVLLRRVTVLRQFLSLYVIALPVLVIQMMASDTLQTDYSTGLDSKSGVVGSGTDPELLPPPLPADPDASLPHLILVVLDEFPLLSLLDASGELNATRYPNFAALAESGVWFRRHTANSDTTSMAIPMMLSGRQLDMSQRTIPDYRHFPDNLFTRLDSRYTIHAVQNGTDLCPTAICNPPPMFATRGSRLLLTLDDLMVFYGHMILPSGMRTSLPQIDQRWFGFRQAHQTGEITQAESEFKTQNYSYENRIDVFRSFIEAIKHADEPQFHYLHVLLPHGPYRYDGSLNDYTLPERQSIMGIMPEDGTHALKHQWYDDPVAVELAERQQLLQVSAVDKLIGDLVQQLKQEAMFDDSLLVVTSDHGAAFEPGDSRRQLTHDNFSRIASVPLFIKYPNGSPNGVSDWHTYSTDIAPMILSAMAGHAPDQAALASNDQSPWPDRQQTLITKGMKMIGQKPISSLVGRMSQLAQDQAGRMGNGGIEQVWHGPDPHGLVNQSLGSLDVVSLAEDQQKTASVARLDWLQNWNPYTGYSLGMFYADIDDDSLLTRNASYVVSVNGQVAGSGSNMVMAEHRQHLRMLIDPTRFNLGVNDVRLFEVSDDGRQLLPLAMTDVDLLPSLRKPGSNRRWLPPVKAIMPGDTIDFVDSRHEAAFVDGWASARSRILWSTDTTAEINLTFAETVAAGTYRVTLTLKPFLVDGELTSQRIRVNHDDVLLYKTKLDEDEFSSHSFEVVLSEPTQSLRLRLDLPDASRPVDFGLNDDARTLAIALLSLSLSNVAEP